MSPSRMTILEGLCVCVWVGGGGGVTFGTYYVTGYGVHSSINFFVSG